jgi:hypothetical protein
MLIGHAWAASLIHSAGRLRSERDKAVPPVRLNSFNGGTRQSHQSDMSATESEPIKISEALAKSPLFKAKRGDKKTSTRALRLAHDAATDISITATRENKMNECNANASRRAQPS